MCIYVVEVESRGVRARRYELSGRSPLFVFVHVPSWRAQRAQCLVLSIEIFDIYGCFFP
jgi:hypothetical protein